MPVAATNTRNSNIWARLFHIHHGNRIPGIPRPCQRGLPISEMPLKRIHVLANLGITVLEIAVLGIPVLTTPLLWIPVLEIPVLTIPLICIPVQGVPVLWIPVLEISVLGIHDRGP